MAANILLIVRAAVLGEKKQTALKTEITPVFNYHLGSWSSQSRWKNKKN